MLIRVEVMWLPWLQPSSVQHGDSVDVRKVTLLARLRAAAGDVCVHVVGACLLFLLTK